MQYLYPALFAGFIMAVAAVGLTEYAAMAFPDDRGLRGAVVVFGLLVAAGVLTGTLAGAGAAVSSTVIGGLVLAALRRNDDLPRAVHRVGLLLLGVLYVGFFIPHVVPLRESPDGWRWALFTVYTAMGCDTGAYFAGRAWGRRKLLPAVSPSKTVEGAFGGLAGAVIIALLARVLFFPRPAVEVVGLALVIAVLAVLGDLCESALKRAFGAKDSGWIIPGHGGILDRLDSLLFPFVFIFYYYAAVVRGG